VEYTYATDEHALAAFLKLARLEGIIPILQEETIRALREALQQLNNPSGVRAFSSRFCMRVSFAGLGTQAKVDIPGGYADVSQTIVLLEGLIRFRRGRRLEPVISIGAGILRVASEGHETGSYIGANSWHVSPAADAGVGLRVPLRPRRVELGFEFHALLAQPYPVVQFFQSEVARAGRPSLLASVTLLERSPDPSDEQIRAGLSGNLCRCTGYMRIFEAVRRAGATTSPAKAGADK